MLRGEGFVGFRFSSGAGIQYGWARVSMVGDPEHAFTVLDYAYGDPGEPVKGSRQVQPFAQVRVGRIRLEMSLQSFRQIEHSVFGRRALGLRMTAREAGLRFVTLGATARPTVLPSRSWAYPILRARESANVCRRSRRGGEEPTTTDHGDFFEIFWFLTRNRGSRAAPETG